MEVLYSLLCEHASVGEEDRLDAEGILHELYAPGFPARQQELTLVTTLEWALDERGRIEFQIELLDPDGDLVGGVHGNTTVSEVEGVFGVDVAPRTRVVLPLDGVIFPIEGRYRFDLVMNGERRPLTRLMVIDRAKTSIGRVAQA